MLKINKWIKFNISDRAIVIQTKLFNIFYLHHLNMLKKYGLSNVSRVFYCQDTAQLGAIIFKYT